MYDRNSAAICIVLNCIKFKLNTNCPNKEVKQFKMAESSGSLVTNNVNILQKQSCVVQHLNPTEIKTETGTK